MASDSAPGLLLSGLDGSNPLAFLAAVGTAGIISTKFPDVRLGWNNTGKGWIPSIRGWSDDRGEFCKRLLDTLQSGSMVPFDIDKKMPFVVGKFSQALKDEQRRSSLADRRDADFLAGFGTDLYPDPENKQFQDTSFRMVRSGDSAGQGLPAYAKAIWKETDLDHIERSLFQTWDYQDEGYSLRWDPLDDQRYALRWRDPSKSGLVDGPGTMRAANSLAIEALRWFPTLVASGRRAQTTGFQRIGQKELYFVWPIWTPLIGMDALRSLLALPDLSEAPLPRMSLARQGIAEVYGSQRIRQNQYYSNFASAHPVG